MINNEAEFLKELLAMFKIEAEEHLKGISSNLLELEKIQDAGEQTPVIETIYREAHSLKGAARAVNLNQVETLCQSLESVFSAMKRHVLSPTSAQYDQIHAAVDRVGQLIEKPDLEISDVLQNLGRLEAQSKEQPQAPPEPRAAEPAKPAAPEPDAPVRAPEPLSLIHI
ncbi:MAG: Hpt domain-containing protein [bacterium]|nr:Hpt domain-containing protein [bacterium]